MIVISGTIDRSWNSRIEKARSPGRRVDRAVGAKARKHLRGRGQGERQADGERGGEAEAGGEIDERGEGEPAHRHLEQAEPEYVLLEPPQPARMELEPDQEEEQDDSEIGDVEHLLGRADQAEAVRADERRRRRDSRAPRRGRGGGTA